MPGPRGSPRSRFSLNRLIRTAQAGSLITLQPRQHRAYGLPPVTQRELPLSRRLAKRAAESRAVEQRVVAEAARAPRLVENRAFHRAMINAHHPLALHQRDFAHEARLPVGPR